MRAPDWVEKLASYNISLDKQQFEFRIKKTQCLRMAQKMHLALEKSNKVLTITGFGEGNALLLLFYIHKAGHYTQLDAVKRTERKAVHFCLIHLITVNILIGLKWALLSVSLGRLSNGILMALTPSSGIELLCAIVQHHICVSGVYDWVSFRVHLHYRIIWTECLETSLTLVWPPFNSW